MLRLLCLALSLLIFSAAAATVERNSGAGITIDGKVVIPDGSSPSNIRVVLNGGKFETITRYDGSFTFYFPHHQTQLNSELDFSDSTDTGAVGFPNGIYSLDVLSTHAWFSTMKLKILRDGTESSAAGRANIADNSLSMSASSESNSIHVVEYKYPGANRQPSTYPLLLQALVTPSGSAGAVSAAQKANVASGTAGTNLLFFQPKKTFNLIGYIMANPMMLMMGVMLIFAVVLPKMMEGMDPEELKKMQEARGGDGVETDPMKALQNLLGGGAKKEADADDEDD